jgi:phage tail sheath protein FI
VLETEGLHAGSALSAASAFVQLGYPWLRTRDAVDLPEGIEPPDGALAGLIAQGALARGTHASVAGDRSLPLLRDVTGSVPEASWGAGVDAPAQVLARRLCLFAAQPGGWALQSDVTTSADEAWRPGGTSRLMATLLRAARLRGLAVVFDSNSPATWLALQRGLEDLLSGFWRAGALAGARPDEAFSVRCDRSTMTPNDIDNGRLIAEISVQPAASIERITVVLQLGTAGVPQALLKEAA